MKKYISIFLLFIFLSGCATMGTNMTKLNEGMTKQEVINTLGNPDGFQRAGEYEALRYSNRLMSGWSWDRADYFAVLKNERLVEWGPGEIRQNQPNVLVLVPLN